MENKMFCYQCQETAGCKGCTIKGVCGKSAQTAKLQDLLIYATKGLAEVLTVLRKEGKEIKKEWNHLVEQNLFITITNANFDDEKIKNQIETTLDLKLDLLKEVNSKDTLSKAAMWNNQEVEVGVLSTENEDIRSLRELITYGLKGMAAYLKHANVLGKEEDAISAFLEETLAKLLDDTLSVDELTALALKTGKYGVDAMALLDAANTEKYGNPEITKVNIGVRKNPAILISGHDLRDLEMLLEQTQGTGVDVYTHSEMLPGNYYPAFKKYEHFVGNYGNAWWKQTEGFEAFHGRI